MKKLTLLRIHLETRHTDFFHKKSLSPLQGYHPYRCKNMRKKIGLLVVHGIGEQKPGESVRNLIEGLELVYGRENLSVEAVGDENNGSNRKTIRHSGDRRPTTQRVRVKDAISDVYIYEVHWCVYQ